MAHASPKWASFGVMVLILWAAWAFRLYGIDWDQGQGLHPDERYISWVASSMDLPARLGDALNPEQSGLNPFRWPPDGTQEQDRERPFSYGHWPLYLTVGMAGGDSDEARIRLVGRALSASFDVLTLLLAFALGRLLYGEATGVLTAAFLGGAVMHIQLSHFATFDTAVTCLAIATLLFATRFARLGAPREALLSGLFLGLAVGAKFSAILLLLPVAAAHVIAPRDASGAGRLALGRRRVGHLRGMWARLTRSVHSWPPALLFVASTSLAALAFGVSNPFALIEFGAWTANLQDQRAMLMGDDQFPFTRQYRGTWPFVYPLEQQLRWGLGILGLVALVGFVYALIRLWRASEREERWIPVFWVFVYFGFFGGAWTKFMRYMLPILPVLIMYGAVAALRFGRWIAGTERREHHRLVTALAAGAALLPWLYALAFLNIYRGEHPWVRVSEWIYGHVPASATLAHERWDHQLPLMLQQDGVARWPGEYQSLVLDPYALDTEEKLRGMLDQLVSADYLVVASNRLYGSVSRWPERYPLMQRYYELLFAGKLGYQLIPTGEIDRNIRLGPVSLVSDPFRAAGLGSPLDDGRAHPSPVTLDLGAADESFTVYDHPLPLLFQNASRLTQAQMLSAFADLLPAREAQKERIAP
jgi:hypothetical protein